MRTTWTEADFDELGWHDCRIHGFRLCDYNVDWGTARLEFDIDYILEWITDGHTAFRFRIAPATLTFVDVFGLRVSLDYATVGAGMTPISIDGIEREVIPNPAGTSSFKWRLPVNWPGGEITFQSPRFTLMLRREPIEHDKQFLATRDRDA